MLSCAYQPMDAARLPPYQHSKILLNDLRAAQKLFCQPLGVFVKFRDRIIGPIQGSRMRTARVSIQPHTALASAVYLRLTRLAPVRLAGHAS
jgi:hypothetical protein